MFFYFTGKIAVSLIEDIGLEMIGPIIGQISTEINHGILAAAVAAIPVSGFMSLIPDIIGA